MISTTTIISGDLTSSEGQQSHPKISQTYWDKYSVASLPKDPCLPSLTEPCKDGGAVAFAAGALSLLLCQRNIISLSTASWLTLAGGVFGYIKSALNSYKKNQQTTPLLVAIELQKNNKEDKNILENSIKLCESGELPHFKLLPLLNKVSSANVIYFKTVESLRKNLSCLASQLKFSRLSQSEKQEKIKLYQKDLLTLTENLQELKTEIERKLIILDEDISMMRTEI